MLPLCWGSAFSKNGFAVCPPSSPYVVMVSFCPSLVERVMVVWVWPSESRTVLRVSYDCKSDSTSLVNIKLTATRITYSIGFTDRLRDDALTEHSWALESSLENTIVVALGGNFTRRTRTWSRWQRFQFRVTMNPIHDLLLIGQLQLRLLDGADFRVLLFR